MNFSEELSCNGVLPSGPCSGWPRARHEELMKARAKELEGLNKAAKKPTAVVLPRRERDTKVKASMQRMTKGLISSAATAMTKGRVAPAIREERFNTCKACPHFIESSKRCSECGCMMEMKTWLNGNPKQLCPKQKWER